MSKHEPLYVNDKFLKDEGTVTLPRSLCHKNKVIIRTNIPALTFCEDCIKALSDLIQNHKSNWVAGK